MSSIGTKLLAPWRNNSAHFHRPWRAICLAATTAEPPYAKCSQASLLPTSGHRIADLGKILFQRLHRLEQGDKPALIQPSGRHHGA